MPLMLFGREHFIFVREEQVPDTLLSQKRPHERPIPQKSPNSDTSKWPLRNPDNFEGLTLGVAQSSFGLLCGHRNLSLPTCKDRTWFPYPQGTWQDWEFSRASVSNEPWFIHPVSLNCVRLAYC